MNKIFLLYVKIESKSSAFGIKKNSGEERGYFLSPSYGQVDELRPKTYLFFVVSDITRKRNGVQLSDHSYCESW